MWLKNDAIMAHLGKKFLLLYFSSAFAFSLSLHCISQREPNKFQLTPCR